MTEQEASKKLQAKLQCMTLGGLKAIEKGCAGYKCDDCDYNYLQGNIGEQKESIALAIEALELRTPKMPDIEGDGYADGCLVYDTWICPHCGKYYEMDYDDYNNCPECGQKIDWEGLRNVEAEQTEE